MQIGDENENKEQKKGPIGYSSPYESNARDRPPGDRPSDSSMAVTPEELAAKAESDRVDTLIQKAQAIYNSSTRYIEANITTAWERNLAHFNSEHAPGSRINSRSYKRSRTFRPKARSSTKAAEAALTTAAFSTLDLIDITAEDPRDEQQIISASINKSALQYRLDRRMPWYLTSVGAYQCTKVYGLCISHQYWRYETIDEIVPATDEYGQMVLNEDGQPMGRRVRRPVKDELCCDLIAPENFRFDAMCDWRDPVGTSPYLIYMMPIYAEEAVRRMSTVDTKTGQPQWYKHTLDQLLATQKKVYDRTRQAREGDRRIDPSNENVSREFTTLWAHMNVIKMDGQDMVYWTMGTELLLSDPIPLLKAFPHLDYGERPFTMGYSSVEAFRNYPAGDIEQGAGLQTEVNEVANQRLDNVKLVLNKRYYVRRGSQVDLDALIRNVPGGGVMMNDPDKDVKTIDTRDVTASSYQEQDRLMSEYDDLVGNFSQASQGNNQAKGGDSKGDKAQMGLSANAMSDYSLRIFLETWMEKTLRQMVKLIQNYETDITILTLAAKQSDLWLRYGIDMPTDELIRKDLTVRVNVGMGNTDPMRKVERLILGFSKALEIPGMKDRVKPSKIADDIFGALGYKTSARFFRTDEEQEKHLEANPPQPPLEMKLKQEELAIRREDNQFRDKRNQMELQLKRELGYAEIALREGISEKEMFARLEVSKRADGTQRDIADQRDITSRDTADQSNRTRRDTIAAVESGKRVSSIEQARSRSEKPAPQESSSA